MRLLGEHLEFDAVHLLKLLSALVGEVDPREVKILGESPDNFSLDMGKLLVFS
jgi:hypothetical protein